MTPDTFCADKRVFGQGGSTFDGAEPTTYNLSEVVYMECPFCRHDIAATWQTLSAHSDNVGRSLPNAIQQLQTFVLRNQARIPVHVVGQWLQCQNTECQEIVIRIIRTESGKAEEWIALPKRPNLPTLNHLISDPFRQDYLEAWTILEDSPRMSGVLSRRLLADLLEKYANLKQFSLASRVEEFIKDTRHPLWLRENLHYLREVGDFGAHTQQDKTAASQPGPQPPAEPTIINVDKAEAEWTLNIIADLFEYFIVAPQKDKEMHSAIDKKLADASRRAITPLTS